MIAANLQNIQNRIKAAALQAGRNPSSITLVAVSKLIAVTALQQAIACGQTIFGENYIQEAVEKKKNLPKETQLHFIGHLQRNKAKLAAETFDMIETVDSYNLAKTLNGHLLKINKTMEVLIQVNLAREPQKSGIDAEEARQLLIDMRSLPQLKIRGLMTMPPFSENPEDSRPIFRGLRILAEELAVQGLFGEVERPELSMGMSEDFTIAIEEGATIIRVGTAIFGKRP